MSSTRSLVAAASSRPVTVWSMWSSHARTVRGVNPRFTSLRRFVCNGSSRPMIDGSDGRLGRYPPFARSELMKTSFAFSISTMWS